MTKPDDIARALRYAAPPPVQAEADELDALVIVRLLRRRIWLIVAVAALVTAIALPAILAIQPVFYASSRLLIQNPRATTLTSSAEDRLVKLNLTTEVERLLSRGTAIRVIRELGIEDMPEFNPALREPSVADNAKAFVRGLLLGQPEEPPTPVNTLDMVIPEFFGALSIGRDPTSDVVEIGFRSHDPELAAAVPNTLLRVYLDERQSHLVGEVAQANDWLQQRIDEQRERVAAATEAVDDFNRSTEVAARDPADGIVQRLAALNAQRSEVVRSRSDLAMTVSGIEDAPDLSDKVVLIDSPAIAALSRDLRDKQYALDRMLEVYGNNNEAVREARAEIDASAAQLRAEIDRYLQSLKTRITKLDREEAALVTSLSTARAALLKEQQIDVQRQDLQRQADAEQQVLSRLEEQRRTLVAEGKLPVADIETLSPATVPLYTMGRGRTFYLAAVLVLAGILGVTAACVVEMLDRSIRSHEQLRGIAGIAPAGMLPLLPRRMTRLPALVARRSGGLFGAGLRGVALALEQAADGRPPASLLVTSPLPGEGKSLVSASLAIELTAAGHKVLLVDADLSHGRLHRLFGEPQQPGVAELLSRRASVEEAVRYHAATGIAFVPRGSGHGAPLNREAIANLLAWAKAEGRIVVMDSAPVLAGAEAAVAAGQVQRTLLVVRWGRTSRHALETAAESLLAARQERILVTINMVKPRRHALYGFRDAALFSRSLRRYQYATF